MGRRAKDIPTPEQKYQADREQQWRDENAQSLECRSRLRGLGVNLTQRQLDRNYPLTPEPEPVTPDPAPKPKRRWGR